MKYKLSIARSHGNSTFTYPDEKSNHHATADELDTSRFGADNRLLPMEPWFAGIIVTPWIEQGFQCLCKAHYEKLGNLKKCVLNY